MALVKAKELKGAQVRAFFEDKKLLSFDADGTLAEPGKEILPQLAEVLRHLVDYYFMLILSARDFRNLESRVIRALEPDLYEIGERILIGTQQGGRLWAKHGERWQVVNEVVMPPTLVEAAQQLLVKAAKNMGVEVRQGTQLFREFGAQLTFAPLGVDASAVEKAGFDPTGKKRLQVIKEFKRLAAGVGGQVGAKLAGLELRPGGRSSIDVSLKGINKAYGLQKALEFWGLEPQNAVHFGDEFTELGNDYPVYTAGFDCVWVMGPEETLGVLQELGSLGEGNL